MQVDSATNNLNKKCNNDKYQCECKKYHMFKKDFSWWNPSICICENNSYLKTIVNGSVIMCGKVVRVKNSLPTHVTNIISTNVTSAVSIN